MASNALELSIKIAGKIDSSFNAAISTAQKQSSGLAKALSTIGKAGLALEGTVLTGVVAMMKDCAEYAQDTETSMADVAKYVSGLTNSEGKTTNEVWDEVDPVTGEQIGNGKTYKENYDEMASELYKLSTQFSLTPEELMTMAADLGQSGYDAAELAKTDENGNVTGVLRDTATMAAAFDIDTGQAGEWMAKWENAFGMSHEEILLLTDQINYLGNTSATTAAEIGEAVNRAGSLGQIAGVSTSTTAALATAMLQAGGDSATVGTSLNRIFVNLTKGSSATETQERGFSNIGMDAETVAKQISMGGETATETLKSVFSAIGALDKDKQTSTISDLFGQWAIGDAARIVGNMDAFVEALDKVSPTTDANGNYEVDENGNPVGLYTGSMTAEANTKNSTTAATEQMKENARDYMKWTVGQELLPAMAEYNTIMRDFYITLAEHAPELAEVAGSFADILSAFVSRLGDILDTALPYLQDALGWLADNPEAALKGIGGITATFATMAAAPQIESVGRILFGGSTGTSGILGALTGSSKTEKSKGILGTLFSGGQSAAKTLASTPGNILSTAGQFWQASKDMSEFSGLGSRTVGSSSASSAYSAGKSFWDKIASAAKTVWNLGDEIPYNQVIAETNDISMPTGFSTGLAGLLDSTTTGSTALTVANTSSALAPIGSSLAYSIDGMTDKNFVGYVPFREVFENGAEGTAATAAGAFSAGTAAETASDIFGAATAGRSSGIFKKGGFLSTLGTAAKSLMPSGVLNYFNSVGDAAEKLGNTKIGSAIGGLFGNVKDFGGGLLGGVLGTAKGAGSAILSSAPAQAVGGLLGKVGGGVKAVANSAPVKAVGSGLGAAGQFLGAGGNLIGTVLSPATSGFMSLFTGAAPIIGVIGTLIGLFVVFQGHLDDVQKIVQDVFGAKGLTVFNTFYSKVMGVISQISAFMNGGFQQAFTKLEQTIREKFGDNVANAFSALAPGIQSVFNFIQKVVTFGQNVCAPILEQIGGFITGTVGPGLLQLFTTLAPLLGTIGNLLGGLIMTGMTLIGNVLGQVIIPAIETVITGVLNFANAVAPTVVSVIEGIAATVTTVVNGIISAINWFIEKVDTLSFDIPEWVPLVGGQHIGFNFEPLPLLAKGGFTSGPSIAGEAGTEAVISFKPSERARNIANWLRAGEMLNVGDTLSTAGGTAGRIVNHVANSEFADIARTVVSNTVVGNVVPLLESAGLGDRPSVADNTASLVPWWKEQTPSEGVELKQIGEGDEYRGNPGGETITFAPVFQFYGDVTKEKAVEAGQISFAEFERLYNEMMRRKARTSWR